MLKAIKNEKGSGLVMVLIVMMIMVVIGTAALTTMGAEARQSSIHDNKTQAYYLARSGAEIAHQWLKGQNYEISETIYFAGSLDGFLIGNDSAKPINVSISKEGEQLVINSTGYFSGSTDVASITIKNTSETQVTELTNALYVSNSLTFSGSTRIYGSVASDFTAPSQIQLTNSGGHYIDGDLYVLNPNIRKSDIANNQNLYGQVLQHQPTTFQLPQFPIFPTLSIHPNVQNIVSNGNLNTPSNHLTLNLDGNYSLNQFNLSSNRTFNINVGNQDRMLVVNSLNVGSGHLNIIGTGTLSIYVTGNITFGYGTLNVSGDIDKLIIYLKGSGNPSAPKNINIGGSQRVYGILFAEDANVSVTNGGMFEGHLITGGSNIIFSGGTYTKARAILAPNAKVAINDGANVKGVVIADEFSMSGNTSLTYTDISGDPLLESIFGSKKEYKSVWR